MYLFFSVESNYMYTFPYPINQDDISTSSCAITELELPVVTTSDVAEGEVPVELAVLNADFVVVSTDFVERVNVPDVESHEPRSMTAVEVVSQPYIEGENLPHAESRDEEVIFKSFFYVLRSN